MRLAYFLTVIALVLAVPVFVFGFGAFGRLYLVYGTGGVLLAAMGSFAVHVVERRVALAAARRSLEGRPAAIPWASVEIGLLCAIVVGLFGTVLFLGHSAAAWAAMLAMAGTAGLLLATLWGGSRIFRTSR